MGLSRASNVGTNSWLNNHCTPPNPDIIDTIHTRHDEAAHADAALDPIHYAQFSTLTTIISAHEACWNALGYINDLKYRDGEIVVDHEVRASADRSLFGIKKLFDEQPEKAAELADELIKNTYRTLLSRGMKGCYIYCCDDQLQDYLSTRITHVTSSQ